MKPLRSFFQSMTGRIFVILLLGVALSAGVAWTLADAKRQADLRRVDLERAADRVQDFIGRWDTASPDEQARLSTRGAAGVRPAPQGVVANAADATLTALLAERLSDRPVQAQTADALACRPRGFDGDGDRRGGPPPGATPAQRQCWIVSVGGTAPVRLAIETPPRSRTDPLVFDPLYMGILGLAAAALSLLVARMAASPLQSLAQAATALGGNLGREPMPIAGPTEVRRAASAFNAMQARLQRQLSERTHMLAAITHDLQTPVTRLRLRLERVQDEALRERLLADLAAMQTLIKEGLELARTADRSEDLAPVDLRSLLESLVEDAADAGQPVTLGSAVEADVRARPESLRRCVLNLIENAIKYGGSAEVSSGVEAGGPIVRIRDHGPGIPEDQLDAVFQPFVRLEDSRSRETGGAGLGLTIARTLAERDGAAVDIHNHPEGGAEAVIRFPAQT